MLRQRVNPSLAYRRSALAVSLTFALGVAQGTFASEFHPTMHQHPLRVDEAPLQPSTRSVTKCDDDGTAGTLRYEIGQASDGETIDLSGLPCTSITLSNQWVPSEITILQHTLTLHGPGDHSLDINGNATSRVFVHRGTGTLELDDLIVTNGLNVNDLDPRGGCVHTDGNLMLRASTVTGCEVSPPTALAYGGGVDVIGALYLYDSQITLSKAASTNEAWGGGVFVKEGLTMQGSLIDSNQAINVVTGASGGGGMYVLGIATIAASTISRNKADFFGGINLAGYGGVEDSQIINSTISDNEGTAAYGGLWTSTPLIVSNSTIAFNRAGYSSGTTYVGVQVSNAPLTLQSSIISDNRGPQGATSDLGGRGTSTLDAASSENLIASSSFTLPADTIRTCARLQPLADNGGQLLTHLPSWDSAALDAGGDGGLLLDERGAPRITNGRADIGAVERQATDLDERIFADGFDGVCP